MKTLAVNTLALAAMTSGGYLALRLMGAIFAALGVA